MSFFRPHYRATTPRVSEPYNPRAIEQGESIDLETQPTVQPKHRHKLFHRATSIFAAALAVRLLAVAYLAHVHPQMIAWAFNEQGVVARSIVTTHSFSSPYHDAHGPTAWLGPVYPAIVAVVFLVFGVQSYASALAILAFNALCSAATGVVVYQLGKEAHSEKAGCCAGWMWAVSPNLVIFPLIVWDTSLSALFLASATLLTLRLRSAKAIAWAVCGALWGVAALLNPALLAPLPLLALMLAKQWKHILLLALVAIAIISPWIIRNYVVFHKLIPIRSNGWAEVYFANGGVAHHPILKSMEYQRLGEITFTAEANRRAVEYIRTHPGDFLRDSLQRAESFWLGPPTFTPWTLAIDVAALAGLILVFRTLRPIALQLLVVLVAYPLIFYACLPISRYRHPIDPVLYALAGIAIVGMSSSERLSPSWVGNQQGKSMLECLRK